MSENPRIDDLRRRVQKDPASIAFAQLAEEHRRAGQLQEAVDVCRAGLAIHPGYLSARVTLGRALLELNQPDEAMVELEAVLKSAPENLAAIRGLAEIYQRRGALPEALAQYRAALTLARNDPDLQQTVDELTRQLAPKGRQPIVDGLSFAQIQEELLTQRPSPPAQQPPAVTPKPALPVAAEASDLSPVWTPPLQPAEPVVLLPKSAPPAPPVAVDTPAVSSFWTPPQPAQPVVLPPLAPTAPPVAVDTPAVSSFWTPPQPAQPLVLPPLAPTAPPVAVGTPEAALVWPPPPQPEPPRKWPPPQPELRAIAPRAPVVPAAPEPVASLASLPRASIISPKPSREQLVIDELELWLDAIHVTRADRQP